MMETLRSFLTDQEPGECYFSGTAGSLRLSVVVLIGILTAVALVVF